MRFVSAHKFRHIAVQDVPAQPVAAAIGPPKPKVKRVRASQAVPRTHGLTPAMWRALRLLAIGERPKGVHLAVMAKMGLCYKAGPQTMPSTWTYVISDKGRDLIKFASTCVNCAQEHTLHP